MNFAVFASGRGTNLQAIIDTVKKGKIKANLSLVISDNPGAYALKRAKKAGVKAVIINPKDFFDKQSFDEALIVCLQKEKIDFIVLAGYMRILSPFFVRRFHRKILNIHPAILPAFKGAHAIKDAFDYGAKTTGVTVHFADEKIDHGPIILQETVTIGPRDTLATLQEKIHNVEHEIYPKAIDLFARGRVKVSGRKTKIS